MRSCLKNALDQKALKTILSTPAPLKQTHDQRFIFFGHPFKKSLKTPTILNIPSKLLLGVKDSRFRPSNHTAPPSSQPLRRPYKKVKAVAHTPFYAF